MSARLGRVVLVVFESRRHDNRSFFGKIKWFQILTVAVWIAVNVIWIWTGEVLEDVADETTDYDHTGEG